MAISTPVVEVLTSTGDEFGIFNAVGDYSSSPLDLYWRPLPNETLYVYTLEVTIKDTAPLDSEGYGSGPELVNGIYAHVGDGGDDIWTFPSLGRLRRNWDWGQSVKLHDLGPLDQTKTLMHARINFQELCGSPVRVSGKGGYHFGVYLNDDFSGLIHHQFVIYGSIGY